MDEIVSLKPRVRRVIAPARLTSSSEKGAKNNLWFTFNLSLMKLVAEVTRLGMQKFASQECVKTSQRMKLSKM